VNQPQLQTILYGQFTPPLVSKSRRHCILQDGHVPRYVPKTARPNETLENAARMLALIENSPGMCVKELQEVMKHAPSYMYQLRDILFDQNKIYGVKGKPLKRGGPKSLLLYPKD
jgi:hypothetical protein